MLDESDKAKIRQILATLGTGWACKWDDELQQAVFTYTAPDDELGLAAAGRSFGLARENL